jgi:hypothetical protein
LRVLAAPPSFVLRLLILALFFWHFVQARETLHRWLIDDPNSGSWISDPLLAGRSLRRVLLLMVDQECDFAKS